MVHAIDVSSESRVLLTNQRALVLLFATKSSEPQPNANHVCLTINAQLPKKAEGIVHLFWEEIIPLSKKQHPVASFSSVYTMGQEPVQKASWTYCHASAMSAGQPEKVSLALDTKPGKPNYLFIEQVYTNKTPFQHAPE